jgi:hypothetical protein
MMMKPLVDLEGERWYAITEAERLPPFLITLASASDHWLFVSSTGALTAGRRDPDHALFPYTTDDRLHDAAEQTGPKTVVRLIAPSGTAIWEPFSIRGGPRGDNPARTTRSLTKSLRGNRLRFEETNHELRLTFSYDWSTSARFGFVRSAALRNDGDAPVRLDLLDGLQNLMPAGLGRRFQMEYSTLADGYKDNEIVDGLGVYRLASLPVDAPEPSEALRANVVWQAGLGSIKTPPPWCAPPNTAPSPIRSPR